MFCKRARQLESEKIPDKEEGKELEVKETTKGKKLTLTKEILKKINELESFKRINSRENSK